ncbi:MAG TPA: hypothetical protein VNC50_15250 [Planctomycetia bacterium]|nr:hypothetical protein [Planctomycetia bacterium]
MRFKLGIALVVGFLEVPLSRLAEHRIVESWIIIAAAISFLAGAAIAFGLRATSDALLIAFAVAAGEILYFACLQVVSGPTPGGLFNLDAVVGSIFAALIPAYGGALLSILVRRTLELRERTKK